MTFADNAIEYFSNLSSPKNLPYGITVMNPYDKAEVKQILKLFYKKFYDDNKNRIFLIGINPGRFGGGLTGIAFTDPINLEEKCGIKNNIMKKPELSSRFVYKLIDEFGGVDKFFSKFFLTAVYPLALIKDGKNHNFYDSKKIYNAVKPEIIKSMKEQFNFGAVKNTVVCLGKKNADYLNEINGELKLFENIITFDHPRFIMQYRLKKLNDYLDMYMKELSRLI